MEMVRFEAGLKTVLVSLWESVEQGRLCWASIVEASPGASPLLVRKSWCEASVMPGWVSGALGWEPGCWGSVPPSATDLLCDLRQVSFPLLCLVS